MKYDRDMALRIRSEIFKISYKAKVAHIPSALSHCDYLGVLFMNKGITPEDYKFVIGKPFGAQAYYTLFHACGWNEEDLENFGSIDPEWRYIIQKEHPLVEYIDESMGNCLSVACGLAMAGKKVFVNISDAALQEGTVWESILFAGAKYLGNIVMAVDYNRMQALGPIDNILTIAPLKDKLEAFGWETILMNGHDLDKMSRLLPDLQSQEFSKPLALIFETVKGYGCEFMENDESWHYRTFSKQEYCRALKSLRL